jgi:hypothetical protein
MVDMYVKIERERLRYLQFNQKKLFVKEFQNIGDGKVTKKEYNYRPISAQSLICKMLSLARYFPMYTDNTQIMNG